MTDGLWNIFRTLYFQSRESQGLKISKLFDAQKVHQNICIAPNEEKKTYKSCFFNGEPPLVTDKTD